MSVVSFHDVRLEVVRPGKPHNQLLSPLTPYMALCGEGSPVTFHVGFEHHQLLSRLDRLRYISVTADGVERVPERMRQAELAQLGQDIARVLFDIPTLSTALARAQGTGVSDVRESGGNVVHLRLILSGSELALIPFELAVAPQGYPGEGVEFCLQSSLPIVLTREIHRDRPQTIGWGQQGAPKILFIWAAPDGMTVPAEEHVRALRAAVEPWTNRVVTQGAGADGTDADAKRLEFVKERLRLLPNASVEQIYKMCAAERFTHVHILAHGDSYDDGGAQRYGVALCDDKDPARKAVVNGKRLAKALLAENAKGVGRSHPLVVTLATCDAGNQSQVLIPGGSIAHQLHDEGIPWVFASQFPLTKSGSVRMTETLYKRLLRGDDPRQVLFELRRELFRSGAHDHDWASLVAYSSVPASFDDEVADYCWRQTKGAIEVCLRYADEITADSKSKVPADLRKEMEGVAGEVREWLQMSRDRMPRGNSPHARLQRAEIIGMHGSTIKRVALMTQKINEKDEALDGIYQEALDWYRQAMNEAGSVIDKYYWTATQYLSLCAVRNRPKDEDSYELARRLAARDLQVATDNSTKAWAHATVAELEMLGPYHGRPSTEPIVETVKEHCRQIIALTGPGSFEISSTMRQFNRYLTYWREDAERRAVAQAAVDVLAPFAADGTSRG